MKVSSEHKSLVEEVAANIRSEMDRLDSVPDNSGPYSALGQGRWRIGSGLACLEAAAKGEGIPS